MKAYIIAGKNKKTGEYQFFTDAAGYVTLFYDKDYYWKDSIVHCSEEVIRERKENRIYTKSNNQYAYLTAKRYMEELLLPDEENEWRVIRANSKHCPIKVSLSMLMKHKFCIEHGLICEKVYHKEICLERSKIINK